MEVQTARGSILVVDDNPLILKVVQNLLASCDYRVATARNGEEALQALNQSPCDVIVCDVMMPRMDGYELHDIIRDNPNFSHIPFVFLTALDDFNEIRRGKEIGADDYLTKPFSPEELLAVVKGKLSRGKELKSVSDKKFDAYKKRVIHTLSHEFRTPLVAINTGTELLIEQGNAIDNSRAQNLLQAIQRGGHRLERLVNDFMVLQQIEAGVAERMFASRAEARAISTVVRSVIDSMEDEFENEGFDIRLHDECSDVQVYIYEAQILDILYRIISNAIKFSSSQLVVDVNMIVRGNDCWTEVLDRGQGIDVAYIQEAIDVFGQINREKLEQQGGGLGLAIASRYASIHNGRLEFANRNGGGSVVSLVLPIHRE